MKLIKFSDIEILEDNDRYYILNGWRIETYNETTHEVPSISKEISLNEFQIIEKQHFREKKLVRILKNNL